MNKVILIGRVGNDPELKSFDNGTKVCSFSVATSEKWKDKNTGEQKEQTEWHKVKTFGASADVCGKYVKKGMLVCVEGSVKYREYEQDGVKKFFTEIASTDVRFLSKSSDQQPTNQPQQPQQAEDDLPF